LSEWIFDAGILVFLIVVAPLWALARTRKLKRESATKDEVAYLTRRIYELEQSVQELRTTVEAFSAGGPAAQPARTAAGPTPSLKPAAPPTPATAPTIAAPPAKPAQPVAPAPAPPPVIVQPETRREPAVIAREQIVAQTVRPAPKSEAVEAAPRRNWADLEEKVGANWLNKVGVAVLVIGGAFLANYAMETLSKEGKAALLYVLAAGMIALGVVGERKEKYRILSRAVLGGGWALAYFTTYAVHHIEELRVVKSPVAGFALLFVVAAAMVAHSLRYDSQVVTGFAYMLAFASVAVSRITVGTMVASAVLAASLVVVLARRRWYELEIPAIVATYGVHWYWIWQIFEEIGGHKKFAEFPASAALLTVYWAIFTVSHFLRDDKETEQRISLTAAFLLNAVGYLAVMRYQSLYPEWRFWFLLGVGIVHLGLAAFSWRLERRLGFLLMSTLGAALVVVAIPYRYAGARLELIWLVEAQALLVVGWRMADVHLRRLGWIALGVLGTYVMFQDLSPRLAVWAPPDWQTGWLLLTLAAAYYLNARYTPRLLGENATETELAAAKIWYGAGTGFLMAAVWFALPFMWVALVWTVLALLTSEVGRRLDENALRVCGHGAALLAAVRLLVINLQYAPAIYGVSLRVLTVALAAGLFYLGSRRIAAEFEAKPAEVEGAQPIPRDREAALRAAYTWTGTTLAALLLWNEVTNAAVGLAWALVGLALLEVGRTVADRPLVAQGHTLLALSFARIFFADLNTERMVGPISARLVTVTLLAAIYYYAGLTAEERTPRMKAALLWFGTAALVALLRFELATEWVAVGWAATTVALYFVGRKMALGTLRSQAYVVTLLAAMRCAFDNFYQTGAMWFSNARTVTVVLAAAMLYALLGVALFEKRKVVEEKRAEHAAPLQGIIRRLGAWIGRGFEWMDANPQQLYFFVPTILVTVLLSLEATRSYLTAVWGLEALVVFLVALKLGERTFRWFSLGLFVLCVGRIVGVDIWDIESKLGRIVSLMGLGAALLLVSFLYARNRELFRKYL